MMSTFDRYGRLWKEKNGTNSIHTIKNTCALVLRILFLFQKHVLKFLSPLCCSVWSNIETSSQVEARALTGKFNILQKVADINMKVKYVFQNLKKSISLLKQITQVCFACNLDSCTLRPEGRYIYIMWGIKENVTNQNKKNSTLLSVLCLICVYKNKIVQFLKSESISHE